jgi:hypothetical protein
MAARDVAPGSVTAADRAGARVIMVDG